METALCTLKVSGIFSTFILFNKTNILIFVLLYLILFVYLHFEKINVRHDVAHPLCMFAAEKNGAKIVVG